MFSGLRHSWKKRQYEIVQDTTEAQIMVVVIRKLSPPLSEDKKLMNPFAYLHYLVLKNNQSPSQGSSTSLLLYNHFKI